MLILKDPYMKTRNRFFLKIMNLHLTPMVNIIISGETQGPSRERPKHNRDAC